jgi:hypothetical protein
MNMWRLSALILTTSLLNGAQSHGGIYNYTIGGVQYPGLVFPGVLEILTEPQQALSMVAGG